MTSAASTEAKADFGDCFFFYKVYLLFIALWVASRCYLLVLLQAEDSVEALSKRLEATMREKTESEEMMKKLSTENSYVSY